MKKAINSKVKYYVACLLFNVLLFAALLFLLELFFKFQSPLPNLPMNGEISGIRFTWGHEVVNNKLGFRERQITMPKSDGVFRVMVLGDSLTWGAGLAVEERYSYLTEKYLHEKYPNQKIEVLNFGHSGAPLTEYLETLLKFQEKVSPDLIVVGFCFNDPQPNNMHYSIERERFEDKFWRPLHEIDRYSKIAPYTGTKIKNAVYRIAEEFDVIPPWPTALDRTYKDDSLEWQQFSDALQRIKQETDRRGLPRPILSLLNQSDEYGKKKLDTSDPYIQLVISWYNKVGEFGEKLGFKVIDHQPLISERLAGKYLVVNETDFHPSASVNQIYAELLTEAISEVLEKRFAQN